MAVSKKTPAKKAPARRAAARAAAPLVAPSANLFDPATEPVAVLDTVTPVLRVKKLDPNAVVPSYAKPGDACFDIATTTTAIVHPGKSKDFHTGLAFEIPTGYKMRVYSRSGHGRNKGVRLANSVGIIDSGFRGELIVCLRNDSTEPLKIYAGDRIAQGELAVNIEVEFEEADALSETERGEGGFGSTGA